MLIITPRALHESLACFGSFSSGKGATRELLIRPSGRCWATRRNACRAMAKGNQLGLVLEDYERSRSPGVQYNKSKDVQSPAKMYRCSPCHKDQSPFVEIGDDEGSVRRH